MKYAAVIEYITDKEKIDSIRPKHREYLSSLIAAGKLACSGPFLDDYGALIVYEADGASAAEELLKADPFHQGGVFVRWTMRPWKMIFSNPEVIARG